MMKNIKDAHGAIGLEIADHVEGMGIWQILAIHIFNAQLVLVLEGVKTQVVKANNNGAKNG